jgi:thioredoxin-related protein
MKKVLYAVAVATTTFFAFTLIINPSLEIGNSLPKPDLKLKDISGKEITMKEMMKENGLLIMFSCNTCPYVMRNQSRTKEICAYALEHNIGVILLNSNEGYRDNGDSFEAMQTYAKEQGYNWPYAVDKNNELADAFGASRTPECFLFDKTSKLVYHGAIDDNPQDAGDVHRQHLKQAIDETLEGKEVTVKESRSVGCTIKRV